MRVNHDKANAREDRNAIIRDRSWGGRWKMGYKARWSGICSECGLSYERGDQIVKSFVLGGYTHGECPKPQ